MKKKLVTLLTVVMVAALAACGTKDGGETSGSVQGSESTDTQESGQGDESSESVQDQQGSAEGTKGQILLADFKTRVENGEGEDLQSLAEGILTNPVCQFATDVFSVEEGLLPGFDNYEVKGFTEGVQFGPAMGSIPFVGYLFRLEEGSDVDAFMQNLEDNCNQGWQMCVAADETVVEASGNTVFFVMCRNAEE